MTTNIKIVGEKKKLKELDGRRVEFLIREIHARQAEVGQILGKYLGYNGHLVAGPIGASPQMIFVRDNGHCGVYDETTGECASVECW